ncbi:hypothetical protein LZY01_19790 [Levilactobacillus zymae]|uniref:Uncharacterized protein n=1 Tax=Levilactobacillus zymae TaxID=267363 RepID=A0ABQ0WYM0_9LACO|nr:hypothetical protein [Levilactobacillus zymae]KRL16498.1 hypothetical protein FD38_GL001350 [Levilactobacillus zymae DSM 19395]QFR61007.1 hypothetical protein LZ395_05435 [Levilactobacillus zymae]GEO72811.1 hypothetical protein LZY01_19790 [Levilactobacillus zymae]
MAGQNLANTLEDDEPLFDAADVAIYLDDKLVKYFNGNDMVSVTWTTDNVTMEIDAQGAGTAVKNHDGRGTMTIHLNRASDTWQDIMGFGASTGYHKIDVTTPYEHIFTSKALLTKNPDINVGGTAQTVDAGFSCNKISLEGNKAA